MGACVREQGEIGWQRHAALNREKQEKKERKKERRGRKKTKQTPARPKKGRNRGVRYCSASWLSGPVSALARSHGLRQGGVEIVDCT